MKFGITGHQERPGIDWMWVKHALRLEIARSSGPIEGLSSLAKGADQVFAEVILSCNGTLTAIIPTDNYEDLFQNDGLATYRKLLAQANQINLPGSIDREQDFLAAGIYIADHVDCLLAVWDGKPSRGKGGTADIVNHALKNEREFVHINPFSLKVIRANTKQH